MVRVMGIDPGMARLGYGVLDADGGRVVPVAWGVVETRPGPMPTRLERLFGELERLVATFTPKVAAVEQLFFGQNTTTAIAVGQARGVVLLTMARAGLTVLEPTPSEVKQAVTGFGKADKTQVQAMVTRLLGLGETPRPDDAADALAVAWAVLGEAEREARAR
jgi:crossover junction endodeoxyribonuclease RuvC